MRVDLDTTGSVNDRLAIHHEGNAAGQIGISGNTVNYGGLAIGTFAGGTDGSDPLTVSFNANANVTAVEAVMRNVTFENVSSNPSTAQRSVKFSVTDGDGGVSSIVSKTIVINDVNVAPVITGANNLTAIDEDAFNNGGMLVSDLISGWITDADPAALLGIAVVGVDNTNGSWEFSTNGGSTWTAFGSPGTDAARLLAANPDTFVRFVPDPNWNGTVTNGITFHAWDQTDGINGDEVDLLASGNVRDQFDTVSYSNTDGSAAWTSDWVEFDDNNSAASGNVRVEAGKLHLDNLDGGAPESITRSADLSDAVTATLTFDYDAFGGGGLDTVAFEISNDGGNSWTLLESMDVIGNIAGSKSYDLESFTTLTADMQIRFRILAGFDGAGEHINFDNVDISYNGTGIGGSSSVSAATASSSITVNAINDAPMMTAWFDDAWTGRKALTIDASQVAGDVSDFPVLITLNVDAELAAQALANGDDIVFTAGDGATQLAHEIEYFDETTGELRAWVKADLSASVDTNIYIYYGNSGATNQQNAAGVWSSNYVGVYHLGESPTGAAGELVDSSGSGNHAVTEGSMDASDSVTTAVGNGLAFDGVDDKLRIPDSASLDGLNDAATFSLWINWADAADGDHQIIMTSENRFSGGDGYEWASQGDGDHFFYPDATSPDGNYNLGPNPFTNGQWHHLAATMDFANKEVKIYVDGNEMTFNYEGVPTNWTDLSASGDLLWGGNPDRASRFFLGMMDEIRLADVVRSQEWIQTEVNNQTNSAAFVTVGTAELTQSQHTLTDIAEDDYNSAGDSVLSIINSVGGDRITDNDDGAVEGVAVVGVDDTNGEWQYDANADGTWAAFGSVSDSAAVLLDTGALVRFVPDPDYNGTAGNLTFRAWDQTSGSNGDTAVDVSTNGDDSAFSCQTATATLNVTPVNDAPSVTAVDLSNINEDGSRLITQADLLTGSSDVDGDGLSAINLVLSTGSGTLTDNGDGTWTFTPTADWSGSVSFSFDVSDATTTTANTASLTVSAQNDAPVAVDDTASGNEDTAIAGNVLTNDTDADGDSLTATLVSGPAHGTLTLNADGSFSYTPDADWNGTDTFSYTANDGALDSNVATVTITVNPVNDAPVAANDTISATEDTVFNGTLPAATDADGDAVTYSLDTDAANGIAVVNADGSFSYTPDLNANGPDSFTYTVSDVNGGVNTYTVMVNVGAVNDAPVANADGYTTAEDVTLNNIDVLGNDTDVDGDTLSVTGATATSGTVTVNPDGTLNYTPNADFNGTDTISYDIADGNGGVATGTLTIMVTAVNDNPVANADSATTAEDVTLNNIDVLANDTDIDGDTLSVTGASAINGAVTVNPDGTLNYTPNGDFNGTDTISYDISDGNGGTSTGTLTITVTAVNDNPVANADSATTSEDVVLSNIDVLGNDTDVDGDTLSVTGATATSGTVTVNPDGTLNYTPNLNFNGTDTINYNIADGNGGVATGTLTITVTAVNDNPAANADSATTSEDVPLTNIDVLSNDTDVDGDTLSVTGASATSGTVTVNPDGTLNYTPSADFNGTDTISYDIADGNGGTDTGTLTITVTAVNDNPVTNADTATTSEDVALNNIDVLGNDTDIDGDTLSVTGASAANGTVTVNPDGTLNYTPNGNFNGTDTISYDIADGNGGTDTGTLTITVTAVNDNPVANADTATTTEDVH